MILKTLQIQNFKNFSQKDYIFHDSFNLIIESNGVGKSNLLEAINILATGKAIRSDREIDCLNDDLKAEILRYVRIKGKVSREENENELIYYIQQNLESSRPSKELRLNDKKITRAKFMHNYFALEFSPESLNLITDSPSKRRLFLDMYLSQLSIDYFLAITRYKKAIKHRNSILDRISKNLARQDELPYWDQILAESVEIIVGRRQSLFKRLKKVIKHNKKFFSENDYDLDIEYVSELDTDDPKGKFIDLLKENYDKELIIRRTKSGSHKDDISFCFNRFDAKYRASRGQQRIIMLVTLLSMSQILEEELSIKPTLLLDDVFSELDKKNSDLLAQFLMTLGNQIFITTADIDELPEALISMDRRVRI